MKTHEWLLITLLICCVSLAVFTCDDGDSSTSSEQADDDDNDDNDSDNPFDDDDDDDDDSADDDDETEENFALAYSGYDQCTRINHADSLEITDNAITVEAWIFPADFVEDNVIAAKISITDDHLQHGWVLFLNHGKLVFYAHGCGIIESRDVISMTKWTHVAGTCDGREVSIYIDGVHAGLYLTTGCQIEDNVSDVTIGSRMNCDWNNFSGLIDEVRISGEALYYDDFTPEETMSVGEETMALLHFNEGEGETAYDAGEHANDGTIYRATWVERE